MGNPHKHIRSLQVLYGNIAERHCSCLWRTWDPDYSIFTPWQGCPGKDAYVPGVAIRGKWLTILQTGQIKSLKDIPADDGRIYGKLPRFQPGNFEDNLKLVHEVEVIAEKKGCTPGQVAIAWVKAQSSKNGLPMIIPIPGATTEERVSENNKIVELSPGDMKDIEAILKKCVVKGGRYPGFLAKLELGDSPQINE